MPFQPINTLKDVFDFGQNNPKSHKSKDSKFDASLHFTVQHNWNQLVTNRTNQLLDLWYKFYQIKSNWTEIKWQINGISRTIKYLNSGNIKLRTIHNAKGTHLKAISSLKTIIQKPQLLHCEWKIWLQTSKLDSCLKFDSY